MPACATTATVSSPIGEYPITCSSGTIIDANYSLSFVNAYLMVVAATPRIPRVTTLPINRVITNTVLLSGMVDPNGAPTTYWFEYGTRRTTLTQTLAQTLAPATAQSAVGAQLTGLAPSTIYYFRVAASSAGTGEGEILVFRTAEPPAKSASTPPQPADSAMSQPAGPIAPASSPTAAVRSVRANNPGNSQTTTLEVVPGRTVPLVVSLAGLLVGTTTATCADLPEGATCRYDETNQTVTITPAATTPPGTYPIRLMLATGSGVE